MDDLPDEYMLTDDQNSFFKFLHFKGGADTIEKTLHDYTDTDFTKFIHTKRSVFDDDDDDVRLDLYGDFHNYGGDEEMEEDDDDDNRIQPDEIGLYLANVDLDGIGDDLVYDDYDFETNRYFGGSECCADECVCKENCKCTCSCKCNTNLTVEPRDTCRLLDYKKYVPDPITIFELETKYDNVGYSGGKETNTMDLPTMIKDSKDCDLEKMENINSNKEIDESKIDELNKVANSISIKQDDDDSSDVVVDSYFELVESDDDNDTGPSKPDVININIDELDAVNAELDKISF